MLVLSCRRQEFVSRSISETPLHTVTNTLEIADACTEKLFLSSTEASLQ